METPKRYTKNTIRSKYSKGELVELVFRLTNERDTRTDTIEKLQTNLRNQTKAMNEALELIEYYQLPFYERWLKGKPE